LGTEVPETINQATDEGIDRDQAVGFQFAEGNMDGPKIGANGAETVESQVGRLPDTHASVAEKQECVTVAIIATQEFLLDEAIVIEGKGARQIVVLMRHVLGKH